MTDGSWLELQTWGDLYEFIKESGLGDLIEWINYGERGDPWFDRDLYEEGVRWIEVSIVRGAESPMIHIRPIDRYPRERDFDAFVAIKIFAPIEVHFLAAQALTQAITGMYSEEVRAVAEAEYEATGEVPPYPLIAARLTRAELVRAKYLSK